MTYQRIRYNAYPAPGEYSSGKEYIERLRVQQGIPWPAYTVDVRDFGATGDGKTDDAGAINRAIAALGTTGGAVYFPQPSSKYLVKSPINLTVAASQTAPGVILRADYGQNANTPLIYAQHTGHVFDCAGATDLVFENICIAGDATTVPQTGWFLARNSANSSAGRHRFVNCRANGSFSVAVLYNYGSEENEWQGCWFANAHAADCMLYTAYNNSNTVSVAPLSSSFITIATGGQSLTINNVFGGSYQTVAGSTANVFHLDSAQSVRVYASWMFAGTGSASGNALVRVNLANAASSLCTFDSITGENAAHLPTYGFWFGGSSGSVTCTGWAITNCRLPTNTYAIYGDNNAVFDSFQITGMSEPSVKGIDVAKFNNSYFKGQNNTFVCRTSMIHSVLVGNSVNWTITGSTDTIYEDTLTGVLSTSAGYQVAQTQVVGTQVTGFVNQTATASKADLGASPTVGALASWASAIDTMLKHHGLTAP